MPDTALASLSDLRLINAEEGLHKMYAVRKTAEVPTADIEQAHADLTTEMRKRGLIYEPLVKAAPPAPQPAGPPAGQAPAPAPSGGAPGQAPGAGAAGIEPDGEYSVEERRQMASTGHAMPDGSFPIINEADLHHAVRLVGQAQDPQAAMMHIIERARAMGMEQSLPAAWRQNSGVASPEAPPAPGAHSMPGPGASAQPTAKKPGMAKRLLSRFVKTDTGDVTLEEPDEFDLDPEFGYAVVKSANEERFTIGPIYLPGTYDAHDEWATAEDLRKSVHDYVRSTGGDRQVYLQHSDKPAGEWIEIVSWPQEVVATMHKSIDGVEKAESVTLPAGTPYLGVVWEPWAWEMVKAKKITGFSMGGYARRVEAEIE